MKYKSNWAETQKKWINYWKQSNTGCPLMYLVARKREEDRIPLPEELQWTDVDDQYLNAEKIVKRYRNYCENHLFLAESFPNLSVDFGPGSLAAYLGSDISFQKDTVWFLPCFKDADDWDEIPELTFDPSNKWFEKHIQLVKKCKKLANNDFYVDIPDLMENIDVLASLRDAQELLYDMALDSDSIKNRVSQVTKAYYQYMNLFYDALKDDNGASAYTVFQIWGPGKTVKLQCDLGATISPDMFRDIVLDSLKEQAEYADNVLYHLDGPDNIRHLDAILEVKGINAIQWTSGDAGPDGTLEEWDTIYDRTCAAGKSLWVKVYSGDFDDWIRNVDRIVQKYGSHSLFLYLPEMSEKQANEWLKYAKNHWSDVSGTFFKY